MKTTNKILLAAAIAVSFTFANRVNAGDVVMSPRAQEMQTRMISGINTDPNLTENRDFSISPKTLELRTRVANGTSNDRDLVAESRNYAGTPKSHDFPGNASVQMEVAPVK